METFVDPEPVYMETFVNPEPVYIKALVNGLFATAILWLFWTPFILVLGVPLVNAQLKTGFCTGIKDLSQHDSSVHDFNNMIGQLFYKLYTSNLITFDQLKSLINTVEITSSTDIPAKNLLGMDNSSLNSTNNVLTIVFIITCILVIGISLYSAYLLCKAYNIDIYHILKFNAVMALIIITIEAIFFSVVAMGYMPFDYKIIMSKLEQNIKTYLEELIANSA